MGKIEYNKLLSWDEFESTLPLGGRSGVGPGEDRLAEILGGVVQGQSESFDLAIATGLHKGKWEVKAPDSSSEIRPGTEGITAFGPLNKTLRNALDELAEFLAFPGVEDLADASGSKEAYKALTDFASEAVTKSGKTNIDLIGSGEITAARFEKIMSVIEATSDLIKNMQGDLLNIKVDDRDFQVSPTKMVKISRLLGLDDSDTSGSLGDAADAAIALTSLNSPIFSDPSLLRQKWEETVDPAEVFDLKGVILVSRQGFMMIPNQGKGAGYGGQIKFSRVTQGKPKFKTPLKGASGSGVWESFYSDEKDLLREFIREALLTEAFTKTDERAIETMARKQIDKKWKDHEKKIDKMFDDRDKTLFRNDAFYKVIARIYQELQRAYAEDQFKYATRYTRKDIPLARFRPS